MWSQSGDAGIGSGPCVERMTALDSAPRGVRGCGPAWSASCCCHRGMATWACVVSIMVSLLLCGQHDTDDTGLCAHIIGIMSSLSLRGRTRHDAAGHVPTLSASCRRCGYLAKRARAKPILVSKKNDKEGVWGVGK